jgi:prephenate dehydrogenase
MRLAFLGLGLIGGSVARAVRAAANVEAELVAWTPRGDGPAEAVEAGVIDRAEHSLEVTVRGADLVVLAAPPRACIDLLAELGSLDLARSAPGVTITDVASTKAAIERAAVAARIPFVGGHPMAGLERTGFGAADPGLFAGRPWIVTDPVRGGDVEAVRRLAGWCGARVVRMAAAEHDELVAGVSHLPLIASVALVEAIAGTAATPPSDWPAARVLAAGGWRDATRLARGDATMGADIAATNAVALAARLRAYRERIDAWIAALEAPGGPDAEGMRSALHAARERLDG